MKTLALTTLLVLCLSAPVFAIEKETAIAPDTGNRGGAGVPDVSSLPESLQCAVLWAYFLTLNPDPTAVDLSQGVRFVEAQMKRYRK